MWILYDNFPRPKTKRKEYYYFFYQVIISVVAVFLFEYVLDYAIENQLIEYSLFITLILAEVPIGVLLSVILGERGKARAERIENAHTQFKATLDFQHLEIYYVHGQRFRYDYPLRQYFVVNTISRLGYYAPDYIRKLEEAHVIQKRAFETENLLIQYFIDNQYRLVPRMPLASELNHPHNQN